VIEPAHEVLRILFLKAFKHFLASDDRNRFRKKILLIKPLINPDPLKADFREISGVFEKAELFNVKHKSSVPVF
jgi:hypothetical protein